MRGLGFPGLPGVFGRFTVEFAVFRYCGDFGDVLQDGDVLERVAVDQTQIGVEAGQDLAEFVGRRFRSVALALDVQNRAHNKGPPMLRGRETPCGWGVVGWLPGD